MITLDPNLILPEACLDALSPAFLEVFQTSITSMCHCTTLRVRHLHVTGKEQFGLKLLASSAVVLRELNATVTLQ